MRFPDDVPVLGDGIVTLRAHSADDLARIVEQCNDPESIAWTTVPVPYGESDARDWVGEKIPQGWEAGATQCFAIEHEGRFAGSVDLRSRGHRGAEVGFGLHPEARGKGVMKRAVNLLLDWGFRQQEYAVVTWRANAGNWASRRVVWAAGFHFGETIPGLLEQRGERYDGWTGWITADDAREPQHPWIDVPVLETTRLRLRPWRVDDGVRLVEASNDERLRRFIPASPVPRDLADVPAYLTRVQLGAANGSRIAWCIADRATDQALGNVALFDVEGSDDARTAQVGFWGHPDSRGRGIMTEAVRRVVDWCFEAAPHGFGVRRLVLFAAVGNTASRRVAEQAGFVHVGTERAAAPTGDGDFDDNAIYDRLRDDS